MLLPTRLLLVFLVLIVQFHYGVFSYWRWHCNSTSGLCTRHQSLDPDKSFPNQELCRLTCGEDGIVWPKPKSSTFPIKTLVNVDIENVSIKTSTDNENAKRFLLKIGEYFKNVFLNENNGINNEIDSVNDCGVLYKLDIHLETEEVTTELTWDTNEQYNMTLNTDDTERQMTILIHGKTVFGVRHGVETLLQLINHNDGGNGTTGSVGNNCYATVKSAIIFDEPAYKHRGFLIDTARNFLSVDVIKKNIIAMAMSKMNVLHWHITDSQSFPFESTRVPNLTRYGAASDSEIYTPDDVKGLIEFAKIHGVRIIPEIDSPAHAGNGWQWGPDSGYGDLVTCYEWQPWRRYCVQPPCGQMNPVNKKLYEILGLLYADILELWPNLEAFHMGGDEVKMECWNATKEIIEYLGPNKRSETDFLDLWGAFQDKAVQAFDSYATRKNTSIILWTSTLTDVDHVKKYLSPSRYIIQSWVPFNSTLPDQLLKLGYKMIISTKDSWYLDHGFWKYTSYYTWRKVFTNRIPTHEGVLGGEVCSWGELVDDSEAEPRAWPRTAAAAERLWSNPSSEVTSDKVEARFFLHRERLVSRGINAAAVTPKYCEEEEGGCIGYLPA